MNAPLSMTSITSSLASDVKEAQRFILNQGDQTQLGILEKRNGWVSLGAILMDWIIVGFSFGLAVGHPVFVLPALLVVGSRQRALSNLIHDASHWSLFQDRSTNDWIVNLLCAYPMFDTVGHYRKSHMSHHRYLGSEGDPDSNSHLRYGYNDGTPTSEKPLSLYLRLALNFNAIKDSIVGSIWQLPMRGRVSCVVWWAATLFILSLSFSVTLSLIFISFWMLSRATGYHLIRIFAEFLDHAGLQTGSVFGFTRNLPHRGIIRFLFNPHGDTFHLVHHLMPSVPFHRLRNADRVLSRMKRYEMAHHCDSYFFGPHSAILCWTGRCQEKAGP